MNQERQKVNPPQHQLSPTTLQDYHDLPIPNEPASVHTPNYRTLSFEDALDDDDNRTQPESGIPLPIPEELTASRNSYRTYSAYTPDSPEHSALMIPNAPQLKPAPAEKVGWQRINKRKRQSEYQNTPPGIYHWEAQLDPEPTEEEIRPDLSDVKILTAVSFLQFCRMPGVKAMKLTWDEPDQDAEIQMPTAPPNVTEVVVMRELSIL
jgi:hypothetical protein